MSKYSEPETPWGIPDNPFHPLVWVLGDPEIGEDTYIGGFSIVNAKGSSISIGANCDIASFVVINCADSHKKVLEQTSEIERKSIVIEKNVFIGTHSVVLGGTKIGHHSVIGAGVVLRGLTIPPYSLVLQGDPIIKEGYYKDQSK